MDFAPFESFKTEWLVDVVEPKSSTLELGRKFAHKLVTQWLDIEAGSEDVIFCDGTGDGGIDVAVLQRAEDSTIPGQAEGDVWYLVQSKYGTAFQGVGTLVAEGQKVIDTLDGKRPRLSSLSDAVLERVTSFRRKASERDNIVLVYATNDPLSEDETRAAKDVEAMGRERLGPLFRVQAVSIRSIYDQAVEESAAISGRRLEVDLKGSLVACGEDLMVGSIPLLSLYDFLRRYSEATRDLDQLYEKNVRRFLGGRRKVNKGMETTIRDTPEKFGLYNNGITVVVSDFRPENGGYRLTEPFVVNGCQTTRTIWEVLTRKLETGGTGIDPAQEEWRARAARGVVVAKIVKVGPEGEGLLEAITRYTNSQNAVSEKDFISLSSDFRAWSTQMAEQYGIFLEIQRGGWESRAALQKQKPELRQFKQHVNAFDLLKIYAAGWLSEAGIAFGRNREFVPGGTIFKQITTTSDTDDPFSVEDLYAAYRLSQEAEQFKFGRQAELGSRRSSRYLYFLVVVEMLRDILVRGSLPRDRKTVTRTLNSLFGGKHDEAKAVLLQQAVELIDEYFNPEKEDSAFNEPAVKDVFAANIGNYLKWEKLGKTQESSPLLRSLISAYAKTMTRGTPSPKELIIAAARDV